MDQSILLQMVLQSSSHRIQGVCEWAAGAESQPVIEMQ